MPQRSLFVYGTLRKEFAHPLHSFIDKNAVFAGQATVLGNLYDLGEYPGAVPAQTGVVHGEVYVLNKTVCQRILEKLDEYEGYLGNDGADSLFVRSWVAVRLADGKTTEAWMYWYQRAVEESMRIPSGDYVAHRLGK